MSSGAEQGEGSGAYVKKEVKTIVKKEEQVVKQEGAVGDTHEDADGVTDAEISNSVVPTPGQKNWIVKGKEPKIYNQFYDLARYLQTIELKKDVTIYCISPPKRGRQEDLGNQIGDSDADIWKAFLNSDVPGQPYWLVKGKEEQKIHGQFSDLRTYLQTLEEQKEVTIYSTSSPSAEESTGYMTLQKELPDVLLIIKIASMIPEVNDEHTGKLWTLSSLENVAVEEFHGFDDWQSLSTCLRQGYTKEEYEKEREDKDETTSTELLEALDIEDRIETLCNFLYSEAHIGFKTSEKYWAVETPAGYRRVYKSLKNGPPPSKRGLKGLIRDLQDRLREQQEEKKVTITLYCSLSPVKHECETIKKFLEKNKDVSLTIKIAGLYRVPRQSCENMRNNVQIHCIRGLHVYAVESYYARYRKNAKALMNIQRLTVETINGYPEWQSLVRVINLTDGDGEAELTKEDYKLLRKDEDSCAKGDLEDLKKQ